MTAVDSQSWFDGLDGKWASVAQLLRKAILDSDSDIVEAIKWQRPLYSMNGVMFCYLFQAKNHFSIGFHQGTQLADPKNLLEGEGKGMRHVKIGDPDNVDLPAIKRFITQAVSLVRKLRSGKTT